MCQYGFVTVNTAMESGSDMAIMAWVEGIPYSASHRSSILTTSGIGGRGQRRISLRTCSVIIILKVIYKS